MSDDSHEYDEDALEFIEDERVRIAALHATCPKQIWLQVDPHGHDLRLHYEAAARIEQIESERDELLACLNLIYSWANNWDSEFMNDPDWINKDGPRIKAAISKLKGQDNDNHE